ncbi:MAG: DNA repair protein RadC, partial [Mogibacterium sp.]|nr:DNA repair protein RadC [Mogibacterium sp.]
MQIKNLPEKERPQEKLLYGGPGKLSNAELLALIIRTGTSEKSAVQLAEDVISYACEEIGDLGRADVKELTEIDGIGTSKACSIVASIELAKRIISDSGHEKRKTIRDGTDVAELLMQEMLYEKREMLIELLLNVKGEVESKFIVSVGELAGTNVHPREVFSPAIRKGAAAVIIAHNHPSGDPTPSDDDILATRRLIEASRIIGIKLVDHVIVGNGTFTSLRAEGVMPSRAA